MVASSWALFLTFVLPVHAAFLEFSEAGSHIQWSQDGGAKLRASCPAADSAGVAWVHPTTFATSPPAQNVTVELSGVPATCVNMDASMPCARHHPGVPELFYCAFGRGSQEVVTLPVAATRVAITEQVGAETAFLGFAVRVECAWPILADIISLAGSAYDGTDTTVLALEVRFGSASAAPLPFKGIAGGNLVSIPNVLAPLPPSPSPSPSFPPSTPPSTPPSLPPSPPPPTLVWRSAVGSGSGTAVWTPNDSPHSYQGAVVASSAMPEGHVFIDDFDVVIKVMGHAYISMGAAYGPAITSAFVVGTPVTGGYGYPASFTSLSSLSPEAGYSGGYHWPVKNDGENTECQAIYSRFQRRGTALRQWYYSAGNDPSLGYPPADSNLWLTPSWPEAPGTPGQATLGSGDGVVLITGEAANSPDACSWTHLGTFQVAHFEPSYADWLPDIRSR